MVNVHELFEILEEMGRRSPEYREISKRISYKITTELVERHERFKNSDEGELSGFVMGDSEGLKEMLQTAEKLHNSDHDVDWLITYIAERYHPAEVATVIKELKTEKYGKKKAPFPKIPPFKMPVKRDDQSLLEHQRELKNKTPLSKLVTNQINHLKISAADINNICGVNEQFLDCILNDLRFPDTYPLIPLAKLFALLNIGINQTTEPFLTTHAIVMIDCIHQARAECDGLPDMKEWEEKINIQRDKAQAFMEPFLTSLFSLQKSGFHKNSMQQIKKERQKEEIARNKANQIPVIKDIIKDKLTTVVPETIAGKSTDQYISEVQKLRERLATYGTFALHFKKALEAIRYEAPALERRFGFKKAHTLSLCIDELYPYELDIKTFVPVCKFLKFTPQTLIPQLENTFLLLQLKKMGEGTTQDKLDKLTNLSAGEKRKWEDEKNRLEAWIRRLTPVITRELSPNK